MTTEAMPRLPDRDEVDATIKRVENQADTIYAWNYARERDQLVTLYNKGVSSQWSSITDLDWSTDVDPEELVRQEPLLRKLLRYVMSDEARHVAFGILSLQELYHGLTEAELKDRQEFLVENTLRSRARSTTPEVWERMGIDVDEVRPFLFEASAKLNRGTFVGFQSAFFAKLVPNVRKLGLLDANDGYLRKAWEEAGLMRFEFADDTGTDYTTYDEVAADRAARAGSA